MELGNRHRSGGSATCDANAVGRAWKHGQEERPVEQRVPGVKVPEQQGDGERQDEWRDRNDTHCHGPPVGTVHPGDHGGHEAKTGGRTEDPAKPHGAVGQPRNERHRLRDRGRI